MNENNPFQKSVNRHEAIRMLVNKLGIYHEWISVQHSKGNYYEKIRIERKVKEILELNYDLNECNNPIFEPRLIPENHPGSQPLILPSPEGPAPWIGK